MGQEYKIVAHPTLEADHKCIGRCGGPDNVIEYDVPHHKKYPHQLLHTLLHELKHAQQRQSGLSQVISLAVEEVDAETTANMLTQLFDMKLKKVRK